MKLEFSWQSLEKHSINVMKISPVGADIFNVGGRADGQTYMMKLIVAFRNFANAPKNISTHAICIIG
jgi:hypothetical protein